ncbi:MAG: hypothetical protein R2713_10310 [Ilumatobacteraceae bacterium]
MYGAVAALVREDRIGMEVLLDDLRRTCTDPTELLATMAFATLDRLDAALTTGTQLSPREAQALAQRPAHRRPPLRPRRRHPRPGGGPTARCRAPSITVSSPAEVHARTAARRPRAALRRRRAARCP